jgi:hypothetical protein
MCPPIHPPLVVKKNNWTATVQCYAPKIQFARHLILMGPGNLPLYRMLLECNVTATGIELNGASDIIVVIDKFR